MIIWTDPAVQAATITTVGTVAATIIAAICASIIGRRFANGDKLKENLDVAINDIAFLLLVEEEHCKVHKENTNQSSKMRIRQIAAERGLVWSGRFTPGRAKSLSQKD